jgi:hypothetical protein
LFQNGVLISACVPVTEDLIKGRPPGLRSERDVGRSKVRHLAGRCGYSNKQRINISLWWRVVIAMTVFHLSFDFIYFLL